MDGLSIKSKREELVRLLSENPSDVRSRIALAKTYFEDGYYEFCLRELKEISTGSSEVASLISKIKAYLGDNSGYGIGSSEKGKTVAEIEI